MRPSGRFCMLVQAGTQFHRSSHPRYREFKVGHSWWICLGSDTIVVPVSQTKGRLFVHVANHFI